MLFPQKLSEQPFLPTFYPRIQKKTLHFLSKSAGFPSKGIKTKQNELIILVSQSIQDGTKSEAIENEKRRPRIPVKNPCFFFNIRLFFRSGEFRLQE